MNDLTDGLHEAVKEVCKKPFTEFNEDPLMRIDMLQDYYDGDLCEALYECAMQAKNHKGLVNKLRKLKIDHPTMPVQESDYQIIAEHIEKIMLKNSTEKKPTKEEFIQKMMFPPTAYDPIAWK